MENMEPKVVDLDGGVVPEENTLIHNAKAVSPALAEMLAALTPLATGFLVYLASGLVMRRAG